MAAASIWTTAVQAVIEQYMRDRGTTFDLFEIIVREGNTAHGLTTFAVIYLEQHFTGDIKEFLRNNFLSTQAGKATSPRATEFLHFYADNGEDVLVRYQIVATVKGETEPRTFQYQERRASYGQARIETIETHCPLVRMMLGYKYEQDAVIHAYSIHAGERAFTYYVMPDEPDLSLYFRNAFNVWEHCGLVGVTTHKPKVEHSIAVTNRRSTFYNRQNEKEYEVETAGLSRESARWLEQLFYSHDVRMATKRDDYSDEALGSYSPSAMPEILITDFTSEAGDGDGELPSVKFTYQFADRRPYLPTDALSVDHERIFTNPYNPTFD